MSRALRHVQRCLERQVQHSELNAFVTCAKATQLQDAANAIDDVEFDRMHLRPSSYSDTDKDRLSACGKNYCHQGQYRHERLSDHSIFKDPRRIQFAIQCDCGRQHKVHSRVMDKLFRQVEAVEVAQWQSQQDRRGLLWEQILEVRSGCLLHILVPLVSSLATAD
jgi:hypothetical protein